MQQISVWSISFLGIICASVLTACGGPATGNEGGKTTGSTDFSSTSKFAIRPRGPNQIATRSSIISAYNAGTGAADGSKGTIVQASYTSAAAAAEIPQLCSGATNFPTQWTWDATKTVNQPRAATATDNLPPKIEQVRNGQVVATYTSFGSNTNTCTYNWPTATVPMDLTAYAAAGCGPFGETSHVDLFRIAQNGDTFLVYPAVYTGSINNIFIAPKPDYYQDPVIHVPSNITIQGVTQNGIRPVLLDVLSAGDFASSQAPIYIWNAGVTGQNPSNIVIQNIDLAIDENVGLEGKSGIYTNGADSLTLRQMRIHGFEMATGDTNGVNGVFTTPNDSGTLTLDQIELYDNGGGNGPAHNIYINASVVDPNYTVHMLHSWSHDAFYGHTFKSRAQHNILEGNYFQGGLPQGGIYRQAENYLVDIPNGGALIMYNNILVKNASGANSNGASVTYDVEGYVNDQSPTPRTYSVDIENNTFVALAATYDGTHPLWPFFFWNQLVPGTAEYEVPTSSSTYVAASVIVAKNVFVGYCPQTDSSTLFMNYRGTLAVTEAFSQLNQDFSLSVPMLSTDTLVGGTPAYSHITQTGMVRKLITGNGAYTTAIGAEDN